MDLDIRELGVDAQRQIRRQCPRGRRPRQQRRGRIVDERKRDRHRRIVDVPIIQPSLKVGQRRRTPRRIRHHPRPTVHHPLFPELRKRPPDALHERRVERLVVIVEIDPAAHAFDGGAPFGRVAHHDGAALSIVLVDAEFEHVVAAGDA